MARKINYSGFIAVQSMNDFNYYTVTPQTLMGKHSNSLLQKRFSLFGMHKHMQI